MASTRSLRGLIVGKRKTGIAVRTRHLVAIDSNLIFLSSSRLSLRVAIHRPSVHDRKVLGRLAPHRRIMVMGAGDSGSLLILAYQYSMG